MKLIKKRTITIITMTLSATFLAISSFASTYDIVIKNGRVIDPETGLDAVRNIGISGDRIQTVSTEEISGIKVIDASGLIVSLLDSLICMHMDKTY